MDPHALFALNPAALGAHVPDATHARGLMVYRSQQVEDFELSPAENGSWKITGHVRGSAREAYSVAVAIRTDAQGKVLSLDAVCSCPVGHDCKHSIAVTLKAAYKAGVVLNAALPGRRAPAAPIDPAEQERARQRARAEQQARETAQRVARWLATFDDDETPVDFGEVTHNDTQRVDRFVYMLIPNLNAESRRTVLHLGYGVSRRLRNGKWAKAQPLRYQGAIPTPPEDAEIVALINSLAARTYRYGVGGNQQGLLDGQAGALALRLAVATGRLFTVTSDRVLGLPVQLGPAKAVDWRWTEAMDANLAEPLWTLTPQLGEDLPCFANSPPLYLHPGTGLCGPIVSPAVGTAQLSALMQAPPIPQSTFARQQVLLLRRLAGIPLPPVLKAPPTIADVTPVAHLRIVPVPAPDRVIFGMLRASLQFDYAGVRHYTPHAVNPLLVETGPENTLLHRDLGAEQGVEKALRDLGLAGNAAGQFHLPHMPAGARAAPSLWLEWADADFAPLRAAGVVLEVAPELAGWITRADTLEVRMDAPDIDGESRSPWFDLSLGMLIDGRRHNVLPLLPELLSQLDSAPRDGQALSLPPHVFVAQPGGGYLRLPTEPLRPWLHALLDLVGERGDAFAEDTLRLTRLEALRAGAVLGDDAHWQGADQLRRMVRQLAGREALPDVAAPQGLNAALRPYQQQGLNWLQFLRGHGLGGILADDMGLGKTLQTLAHVLAEKEAGRLDRPALIIAPVSLLGNWRREAERFTPGLRSLVLHGEGRHAAAAEMTGHDLVIAPYSLLQRDRDRWLRQAWHLVVLDEAQNIKNANTHAAQVAAELDTRHRLCLSGTPMENHLGELWSLFHFLMPGFLGSQARFKTLFRTPIEKHGDGERLVQLRARVTPFMLRRAKGDVATDLPEKQEAVSSVALGDQQADLYETIRLTTEKAVKQALAEKGLAKSQIQILDALLKLRQVCCDPRLVPVAAARKVKQSAKLALLMELLPEMLAEGRRVLLFSQFTSMLELIEEELAKRQLPWVKLTGQSQKRDALIERFTSGEVPLFLISLKAGGVGLNLTQADTVIHYDPWWNPAVERQATDRAHRIGQTRNVFVYKLVAQGTIEERILALQERKAALADSMYSGAQARKQPLLTESDLAELLKPL